MENPYKGFSNINPQKEDGHREIETSILQALIGAGLSGLEYALVLFIIDRTWGWNKKEDTIALSQFGDATGHDQSYIVRSLKSLEKRHLIIVKHGGGRGRLSTYMFNKYWDTWIKHTKRTVTNSPPLALNSDPESPLIDKETMTNSPPLALNSDPESPFKEINSDQIAINSDKLGVINRDYKSLTIDNIDTYNRNKDPLSEAFEIAGLLKSLILKNNSKAKTPADITKWATDIDRMIRIDHITPDEIKFIIEFSQNDSFWCANILSAGKLRDKYDQLYLRAKEKEKSSAEKKEKGGETNVGTEKQRGGGTQRPRQERARPITYTSGSEKPP